MSTVPPALATSRTIRTRTATDPSTWPAIHGADLPAWTYATRCQAAHVSPITSPAPSAP
nr:hypothetical protein [Streptomyces sp. NRRL F-5755]